MQITETIVKTISESELQNIQAAELMGKLHDRLKDIGYEGHPLELLLVRILFVCRGHFNFQKTTVSRFYSR